MERLTRRDFLKIFSLGALSFIGSDFAYNLERIKRVDWLEDLASWKFFVRKTLDSCFYGSHIVTPFLYTSPKEVIEKNLDELGYGFRSATIFIDDRFEKTLGTYELGILDKAREYAEMLYERDMGIIVVMFDCYTLRKTWNPVYGGHEATSSYAVFGEEEFFRNTLLQEFFKKRVERIVKGIKKFPNLFGVVIANEPNPPRMDPYDEDFVFWFNSIISLVREKLTKTPILPGVANPYFISEEIQGLSANTAHVYLHDPISFLRALKYSESGKLPLFVHELGIPERFFGVDVPFTDEILSFFTRSLLIEASNSNYESHEVELGISSLTFWKKDYYFDGFNFDSKNYPKTYKIIRSLDYISRAILSY